MGYVSRVASALGFSPVGSVASLDANAVAESMRNAKKPYSDEFSSGRQLDYVTAAAYTAIFTKVSTRRKQLFEELDIAANNYLIDALLDMVSEYALAPDVATDEVLEVTSEVKEIKDELDGLDEKFGFDQIALAVAREFLKYGSYYLKTEVRKPNRGEEEDDGVRIVENEDPHTLGSPTAKEQTMKDLKKREPDDDEYGLIGIDDSFDQKDVVPLSSFTATTGYLFRKRNNRILYHEKSDFIEFSMTTRKMRVDMSSDIFETLDQFEQVSNQIEKKHKYKIPRYIRVGKPLVSPNLIGKVKELDLLERLVPASKLSKLANGSLIQVSVPENYEIEEAMKAMRHIEGILNTQIGINVNDERQLTVENLMNTSSKIKCIPNMGGNGELSPVQARSDEPDDLLASANDIRSLIMSAFGVPPEILFSGDGDKKETLKRYARFMKLLRNVQKAITNGLRQMCLIHLQNKFPEKDFDGEDIKVIFSNKIVEIDALDTLEFADAVVSSLDNIKNLVFELAGPDSPVKEAINLKAFTEKLANHFETIGFENVILPEKVSAKAKIEVEAEEE